MHYLKVVCEINERKEIAKHYDLRYGAPGMSRKKKRKKTPDEMAAQNLWRKTRDLRRLLELNFRGGDWHVTLTCRKDERPAAEEAPARIRAFRDSLRKKYRKLGWELKYIIVCGIGERGAIHWHMVINNEQNAEHSTAELIRKLWTLGRAYFSQLDDSGEYKALAEYLLKQSAEKAGGEKIEKLSYMPSRNLTRPVERTEKIRAKSWRKEPPIPEGWELVPGSLVNGINKYNGYPYQHYTIRRREKAHEAGGNLHRDKPAGVRKGRGKEHVYNADQNGLRKGAREKGADGDGRCYGEPAGTVLPEGCP